MNVVERAHNAVEMVRRSGMESAVSAATVAQYSAFCYIVTQTTWDPYLAAERLVVLGVDAVLATQMAYQWTQDEAEH